ncbi:transcriptional regulator, LysR family [Pseudomonas sp. GM41(2012)]|uniref:LysR family transcriptional regulator n=1 Tax=Pseudomonas sp. (strain GM41(2012)) TaxID=1144708 RepID=UPI0002704291|nr:LysR family transcriptional regulator [Pseudomonas sp. GM41(2012)]EUB76035.1 transcriptional regulator, LysR family [Pseudomonas sp. GM41(2012)]
MVDKVSSETATSSFNAGYLSRFNLNCLVIFATLYREKSVTRTSELLNIGQPAVSNSLSKLRLAFQDQLFHRKEGAMAPTQVADNMAKRLIPLLSGIQCVLEQHADNDRGREPAVMKR